jgi:hypothetical protein
VNLNSEAQRPTENPSSVFIDGLFALSVAALFSGLHQALGPVKVGLSDLLEIVSIFVVVLRGVSMPYASRVILILLGGYLLVFLLSALSVGTANGAKEIVQAVLLLSFLCIIFGYYRNQAVNRFFLMTAILLLAIMTYNIIWHVTHGKLVGWKELNEPKAIFMLLPMLLLLATSRNRTRQARYWIAIGALAVVVIVFLSGERKAYMFTLAAFLIWNGMAVLRYAIPAAVVAIPVLLMGVGLIQNNYLNRQIASLTQGLPGSESQPRALTTLLDEHRPMTMSNAQREHTLNVARSLWREKPLLGIGTNAFSPIIEKDVSLPLEFRVGIHGEFYRALYENGLIGLFLYASIWIAAFTHVALTWRATSAVGGLYLNRLKLATLTMFLIYCSVEASKGLTFLCIAALPFIVALRPKAYRMHHWGAAQDDHALTPAFDRY